jgi:hypothetical protein
MRQPLYFNKVAQHNYFEMSFIPVHRFRKTKICGIAFFCQQFDWLRFVLEIWDLTIPALRNTYTHRHSPTYAIVTSRKFGCKYSFAQVGMEYTYGHVYIKRGPVELQLQHTGT